MIEVTPYTRQRYSNKTHLVPRLNSSGFRGSVLESRRPGTIPRSPLPIDSTWAGCKADATGEESPTPLHCGTHRRYSPVRLGAMMPLGQSIPGGAQTYLVRRTDTSQRRNGRDSRGHGAGKWSTRWGKKKVESSRPDPLATGRENGAGQGVGAGSPCGARGFFLSTRQGC